MDVKRAVSSYGENRLEALRLRMMAVAAIASSWLGERQGPVLVEVGTAIIDGADEISAPDKGVFALSEIGDLLEVEGADEAMKHLRAMFARRVQAELESQCRKALRAGPGSQHEALQDSDQSDMDVDERQDNGEESFRPHVGPERGRVLRIPSLQTNVRVGFARSRASP
ncbi:hypothetical protein RFM68_21170 [Mesorhizobium sp. MSK_1335]|uniref:Uncharacterized protein n=1 Tax=Mesorhizobium montanum TaxID=3072323 RepID=A0ABU4ZNR6_9HYPH|nr:hypothetical protein [Mesorhizobium sp. MSK_1335]MDX8527016.1 hypothetical protein [Mesorhizobium sp. MSK_1335]